MERDLPPPYSEACAPPVGFNIPSYQPSAPQIPNHQIYPGQPVYAQAEPSLLQSNVGASTFGPYPQPVTCPMCQHPTFTKIIYKPTFTTHLIAAVLCLLGCIPCCLLPYCMDCCQDRDHHCSHCSAYLGTYTDTVPYHRRTWRRI